MLIIQISAAKGPVECRLAVLKAFEKICQEANISSINCTVLTMQNEIEEAENLKAITILQQALNNPLKKPDNLPKSFTMSIEGKDEISEKLFIKNWCGTLQWICQSPFRKNHKRKNWFIGVKVLEIPEKTIFSEKDIQITAMRSSGAGGQHINKTNSAIRIIHIPTNLSVKVESERSQHQNKKIALSLLNAKLEEINSEYSNNSNKEKHQHHQDIERGNPVKTFKGMNFDEQQ